MLWRCQVTGVFPVRDAITKESVAPGGVVVLDDSPGGWIGGRKRSPGEKGGKLAGTLVEHLAEAGSVTILGPHQPGQAEG